MPATAVTAPTVGDVVERYLTSLRSRGLSARTVRNYYRYPLARHVIEWCEAAGIRSMEQLGRDQVEAMAAAVYETRTREGKLIARPTALAYLKSIRHFLTWTGSEVAAQIKLPRPKAAQVDILTEQEIHDLEAACLTERNRLIIRLLSETGIREGELVSIRRSDLIERDRRWHFVKVPESKTLKERTPPITPDLYRRLKAYAEGAGRPKSSLPELFITHRAKNHRPQPLTASGVYQVVKDAAERAADKGQISKRVTVHLFRHTAITRAIAAGESPLLLSKTFGVSVSVIANHYSHPTMEQMAEAMMRVLKA